LGEAPGHDDIQYKPEKPRSLRAWFSARPAIAASWRSVATFLWWVGAGLGLAAGYALRPFGWLGHWLTRRSLLELIILLLLAGVLRQISRDYLLDPVVIDPIAVPQAFEERGYTPQTFANQIRDQIDEIKRAAMTRARKEGLAPENSRESGSFNKETFGTVNKESFAVANSEALPDIEIPETALSFRAVVDFIEGLFPRLRPRHISGEVTIVPDAPAAGPAGAQFGEATLIAMRVTRMGKGDPRLAEVSVPARADPKDAITQSAKEVLQLIDPYVVAAYEYEVEKDQRRAWYLTTECHGDLEKWGTLLQGIMLEDQKKLDDAIAKYQMAARLDPQWAYPYNNWANALAKKNEYNGAIDLYREAIHRDRKYADAYDGWGLALSMKRDYAGAIAEIKEAVTLDPGNSSYHAHWGNTLGTEKDYDEAIVQFQQAVALDPGNADAHDGWGIALGMKKEYDGAITQFQQAAALNPTISGYYANWGITLASKNDYDGAIKEYQQAVRLDPGVAGYHYNWGRALSAKNDYGGAIAQFQQAVALDPRNADAYDQWGIALGMKKDYDGSIARFQQAVALDPRNGGYHYNWGTTLDNQKDYDGALKEYQQAAALEPNNALFHDSLGLALAMKKDYDGAIAQFQQAVAFDPGNGMFRWHLSTAEKARKAERLKQRETTK